MVATKSEISPVLTIDTPRSAGSTAGGIVFALRYDRFDGLPSGGKPL